MRRRLAALDGAPAVIIANAGEVNAGDFDPLDDLADLAERYGAWLHVDGAFGLFAALSPAHRAPGRGHRARRLDRRRRAQVAQRAVRERVRAGRASPPGWARAFGMPGAAYLPGPRRPAAAATGCSGPESSRRARALPIWATLAAYGRDGLPRHGRAPPAIWPQHLAGRVDAAPDLERLAEVPLCIVCFRYRPAGRARAGAGRR